MIDKILSRNVGILSVLFGWFFLSAFIAFHGGFVSSPLRQPVMLGLGVVVPIALLVAFYLGRQNLWSFANSLDLRLLVLLNLWRFVAVDFILHYYDGALPAGFAFPAGIGDIVTAAFSIPLVMSMQKNPAASYKRFLTWNVFGILDLVVAISAGVLHSESTIGFLKGDGVSTTLMSQFPHSMVPTFFVPLFIAVHLLMIYRSKELIAAR